MAIFNSTTRSGFQFTHNGKVYDFASIYVSKSEVYDTTEVTGAPLQGIGQNDTNTGILGIFPPGSSSFPHGPNYVFGDYSTNWNSTERYKRGRWTSISIGNQHAAGIVDGLLYIWGRNNLDQLGTGTGTEYTNATPTSILPIVGNWTTVECGNSNTAAIGGDDKRLYLWGHNNYGQSGNYAKNSQINTLTVPTSLGSGWDYIFCGFYASYGLKEGKLYQWGEQRAHLGGSSASGNVTNVTALSLDRYKNRKFKKVVASKVQPVTGGMALFEDGRVITFGQMSEAYFGFGSGSFLDFDGSKGVIPYYLNDDGEPTILEDCIDIACEGGAFVALKQDGTLWGWGSNFYGQLSYSSQTNVLSTASFAVQMNQIKAGWAYYGYPDLALWKRIGCANGTTYGIKTDGTLWATGRNNYGQCGDINTGNLSEGWNRTSQYRHYFNKISCGQYSSLLI